MATERILIHSSIVEPFSTAFKAAIEKFFTSNGSGPILVTPAGVTKNKKLIDQAVSRGATLLVGDLDTEETSQTRMRPFVLENVNHDMDIYQQESFGPSVSLFSVETEDEAIAIANDTEYGLSASVFTRDLAAGLRVAKQIESGYVCLFFNFGPSSPLFFSDFLSSFTRYLSFFFLNLFLLWLFPLQLFYQFHLHISFLPTLFIFLNISSRSSSTYFLFRSFLPP